MINNVILMPLPRWGAYFYPQVGNPFVFNSRICSVICVQNVCYLEKSAKTKGLRGVTTHRLKDVGKSKAGGLARQSCVYRGVLQLIGAKYRAPQLVAGLKIDFKKNLAAN